MSKFKRCSKCGEHKSLSNFRLLIAQGRYASWCSECERLYQRGRQAHTTEQDAIKQRRRYAVKAIVRYIDQYGDDIIQEALSAAKKAKNCS